jgi:hypothetical protein
LRREPCTNSPVQQHLPKGFKKITILASYMLWPVHMNRTGDGKLLIKTEK